MKRLLTTPLVILVITKNIFPAQQQYSAIEQHNNVWHNFRQYQSSHINKDVQRTTEDQESIITSPAKKIIPQTSPGLQVVFNDDDEDQYSQYEDAIELIKTFPQNQNKKHTEKILDDLKYTHKEGLYAFINEYDKHDIPTKKSFAALFFDTPQDHRTSRYPTIRIETKIGEHYRLIFNPHTHRIMPLIIPHQSPEQAILPKQTELITPNTSAKTSEQLQQPITTQSPSKPQNYQIKKRPDSTIKLIKKILRIFGIDVDDVRQKKDALEEFSNFIIGLAAISALVAYFVSQVGAVT